MIGFILTGHGHFSTGLKSSVDMVAGPQEHFEIVPVSRGGGRRLSREAPRGRDGHGRDLRRRLVFVDLVGGTPFNQSMLLSSQIENLAIVAGTNLPMLIDIVMARSDTSTLAELVDEAVAVGKEGVCTMSLDSAAADEDDE